LNFFNKEIGRQMCLNCNVNHRSTSKSNWHCVLWTLLATMQTHTVYTETTLSPTTRTPSLSCPSWSLSRHRYPAHCSCDHAINPSHTIVHVHTGFMHSGVTTPVTTVFANRPIASS
jgi:hypothetical protein